MSKNWIVVANSVGARIFSLAEGRGGPGAAERSLRLEEMETLAHPERRMKNQEIDADRPGRSFESGGAGRHGMGREVEPRKQENIAFARRVVDHLEQARQRAELERLIIVAGPEFLGLLREKFSAPLQRLVEEELSLDLVAMKPEEILSHLPEKIFGKTL